MPRTDRCVSVLTRSGQQRRTWTCRPATKAATNRDGIWSRIWAGDGRNVRWASGSIEKGPIRRGDVCRCLAPRRSARQPGTRGHAADDAGEPLKLAERPTHKGCVARAAYRPARRSVWRGRGRPRTGAAGRRPRRHQSVDGPACGGGCPARARRPHARRLPAPRRAGAGRRRRRARPRAGAGPPTGCDSRGRHRSERRRAGCAAASGRAREAGWVGGQVRR
jgi:hypothetical protein